MRLANTWQPSKFFVRKGKWFPSLHSKEVAVSSRVNSLHVAGFYAVSLAQHAKGDLLDLGCGKVPLYGMYQQQVKTVTCVDWENSPHALLHVDVFADLNQRLPLDNNSFDTIILSDVLEHVRQPELLLEEVQRVLRPGGNLILNVPFYYWLHEEPSDFFRYTQFALKGLMEEARLEITHLQVNGGSTSVVFDVIMKRFSSWGRYGKAINRLFFWMYYFLLFREHSNKPMDYKMPLGYGLVAHKQDV